LRFHSAAFNIIVILLFSAAVSLLVSQAIEVDSIYDLFFESGSLLLIVYIYFISRKIIGSNLMFESGFMLLIFNKCYDLVTEIRVIDRIVDQHELLDSLLEDGLLQLSVILIATGATEIFRKARIDATSDELTGLKNRKLLTSIPLRQYDLVYMDLDSLKLINDTSGHAEGDRALIHFSQTLKENLGSDEQAFRLGGDEFIVVVARGRGQAFVGQIEQTLRCGHLAFSYGIAAGEKHNLHQAIKRADEAMYQMKHARRMTSV